MKSDTGKETFLRSVRQALSSASRPGADGQPRSTSRPGESSCSADPVADFCKRFADAGGLATVVENDESAFSRVAQIIENVGGGLILLGAGPPLERLHVGERLQELGHQVTRVHTLTAANARDVFFRADVSVSGVDYLIAETGSIAVATRPEEPRSLTLLPPVHVAVADEAQLLPDLFDLFDGSVWQERGGVPSCLTLITGPSKTGDIELRLVTGVHGPREIHLVLIRADQGRDPQFV
jgi:L-lactate dehydrogenase complex protein LldG